MHDPRHDRRWSTVRRQAFDRDKKHHATCWICGQPIDYSVAPSATPMSYEPDHRLPVSRHPELAFDLANILPSHKKCNRARGDKAGINQVGKPSRNW